MGEMILSQVCLGQVCVGPRILVMAFELLAT